MRRQEVTSGLARVHSAVQTGLKGHMAKPLSPESCSIIHPSISSPPYSPACTGGQRTHLRFMSPPPELEHPPRLRHERRVCLFAFSCQVPQLVQRSLMVLWPRREAAGRICPAASLLALQPHYHPECRCMLLHHNTDRNTIRNGPDGSLTGCKPQTGCDSQRESGSAQVLFESDSVDGDV